MAKHCAIGLMSGTSMDGVDAVLASFGARRDETLFHIHRAYPKALKADLEKLVQNPKMDLTELGRIHNAVGEFFAKVAKLCMAEALARRKCSLKDIIAIGSHGQTVWHAPEKAVSWQLGNPNIIAARTGRTVVADFRQADLVHGGEGAPFLPRYHQRILGKDRRGKAIHNLGGISNFTYFGSKTFSFALDTGPANCLLDVVVEDLTEGKQRFDKGGAIARKGEVQEILLREWMNYGPVKKYLRRGIPKSTGRELFSPALARHFWSRGRRSRYSANDIVATMTELTVRTSVDAYERFVLKKKAPLKEIWVTGGGANNPVILKGFREALPKTKIRSVMELGIDPQCMEAQAFAYYALLTLNGLPANLSSATGARKEVPCGGIYPGANYKDIIRAKISVK